MKTVEIICAVGAALAFGFFASSLIEPKKKGVVIDVV